jgi:hypothetical protein
MSNPQATTSIILIKAELGEIFLPAEKRALSTTSSVAQPPKLDQTWFLCTLSLTILMDSKQELMVATI